MLTEEIRTAAGLERALATPSAADIACLSRLEGDVLVLGAGGKMGPSLARLCRNAADAAGKPRRVIAVSRGIESAPGVEAVRCDLLDRSQVARLPEARNVLYLAGRKFGSTGNPELTWAMNAVVPAIVAERFPASRIVAFSTGNVYPFRDPGRGGATESGPPAPVGEYAWSCLARERVFEHYSKQNGAPCLLYRLNYAVDLRYGVLVDIARKVHGGEPVDITVPAFNVIWQRDANSYALRALEHCATPARILNVTGPEILPTRDVAQWFAKRFGRECRFQGTPGPLALLSDASECLRLMGPPTVTAEHLMEMVAVWIESGGASLDKPTHFEVADGKF
jgi:nucleoside-diphosphate-sugar epimerase